MGCNTSQLDRLPAVTLCRDRCKFLEEALRQSYALADAHVTYMESLKTLGPALHSFFQLSEDSGNDDHSRGPTKNNNNNNDVIGDTKLTKSSPPADTSDHSSSSSDSGSQIQLHFDDDTDKDFQNFNRNRYESFDYVHHDAVSRTPDNVVFMNYVQPQYPPFSPPLPNSNSKPPSPPPPISPAWDFLNLFDIYAKYEMPYSSIRDIKGENEKERSTYHNLKSEAAKKELNGEGEVDKAEIGEKKNEGNSESTEKILISDKKPPESKDGSNSPTVKSPKDVSEVMKEIQILFQRASDSGIPILEMLDVGKLRYHRKITVNPGRPTHVQTLFITIPPCTFVCFISF